MFSYSTENALGKQTETESNYVCSPAQPYTKGLGNHFVPLLKNWGMQSRDASC